MNKERKTIVIMFPFESIFNRVKEETSYIAERTYDTDGKLKYEELVFDEEYIDKFLELFQDAQANITQSCSAYLIDNEDEAYVVNDVDHQDEKDFMLTLFVPKDFKSTLVKTVNSQIRQYLVAYVCYRWLETKLTKQAEIFLGRADETLADIVSNLEKGDYPKRLKYRLF